MSTITPAASHHATGSSGTPAPPARRATGPDWLWAALLTFAVACVGSGNARLWRDELASWNAAVRDTGDLIAMLGNVDAVSGTYYLLLHFWVSVFGDSEAMLRMPSALAMAGAAAFVVLAARKAFDRRTAVFAGLLFAFLPSVSRYGQEARGYAFAVLGAAAAIWLLMRALERPTFRRWLPYALAVAFTGVFHVVSLLYLVPHAVVVLMRWWRHRWWRLPAGFLAAVLAGVLPLVPLMRLGQSQVGRQISWLKAPHLRDVVTAWQGLFGSPLVALAIVGAALLPLAWQRGRRPAVETGLIAALPIGVSWVISQGSTAYFFDRYLLFTLPAWTLAAAAGLAMLRPKALGAAGLAVVVLLGAADQRQLRTTYGKGPLDGKAVADVIAAGYRPGDGFAPVRGGNAFHMFDFATEYHLPDNVRMKDVFVKRSAREREDLFAVECAQPAECAQALEGVQRIWVVTWSGTRNPYHTFPRAQADALRAHYAPVRTTKAGILQVTLVERVPAKTPAKAPGKTAEKAPGKPAEKPAAKPGEGTPAKRG
ncbi:glycosyltransferase family 39 protein [Streptomyces sp. NPDC048603]|uniref:glycosyltransferase family 39 protein n=1 Tax=Streptomyces sp. NPDC048603 TaxID=3365577 RepID=UPI00371C508A